MRHPLLSLAYPLLSLAIIIVNHRLHSVYLVGMDIFARLLNVVILNGWDLELNFGFVWVQLLLALCCLHSLKLLKYRKFYVKRWLLLELDPWPNRKEWGDLMLS